MHVICVLAGSNPMHPHASPMQSVVHAHHQHNPPPPHTQEFDVVLDPSMTPKQRLAAQRENMKRRLGLDTGLAAGVDMGLNADDLFGEEDLEPQLSRHNSVTGGLGSGGGSGAGQKQAATDLLASMGGAEGLSARERNRLKRKAKALSRTDSVRSGTLADAMHGARQKVRDTWTRVTH